MQYYRCRCGAEEAYGSLRPYRCIGCSKCNTTLELHPRHHREPLAHDWEPELVRRQGQLFLTKRCARCGQLRLDLEVQ